MRGPAYVKAGPLRRCPEEGKSARRGLHGYLTPLRVVVYASPMQRAMKGFQQDEEGHWVAQLSCGHRQHVRHRPPFELRPWVVTAGGREGRLGQSLECAPCDRGELPEGFAPYRRTATFSEDSIPPGLLREHSTKAGVWARIIVEQGQLQLREASKPEVSRLLRGGEAALMAPEVTHQVEPGGVVRFHVEFWAAPREAGAQPG